MPYLRIQYDDLNPRQQENYNYHKASAILADYGFTTIRLNDDWQGADFIAQHTDGITFLKVQLKGRASFAKKYIGRDLHICFPENNDWYLYPHDEILNRLLAQGAIAGTVSWDVHGVYHFPNITANLGILLDPHYNLAAD